VTEAEWQRQVTDLAGMLGWTWAHFRPARTEKGWRTPVEGPGGAGFPDLVLWRGNRVLFVELKTDRGAVSDAQSEVLDGLARALEVYVWRPRDFDYVAAVLT
jgi:hypothetical protein